MFERGEYVIYGSEGVCRVENIGNPQIQGLDKSKIYYTLSPFYRRGTIHTPIDTKILMRRVVSKEYASSLIENIKNISYELDVPKDQKLANIFYRDLVRSYDCAKLISIVKYVFNKQREFAQAKKNLPAVDVKFSKMAEEMLCSEFAFVLNDEPKGIKTKIIDAISNALERNIELCP